MLLNEIHNPAVLTVRIDQVLSDLIFDTEMIEDWEDISEVPEPLKPLIQIITPVDNDYRGMASGDLLDLYSNSPEWAFYTGVKSGKLYQQDLLNDPQAVALIKMTPKRFMSLVQQHAVKDPQQGRPN
jgi:hypothetical protein